MSIKQVRTAHEECVRKELGSPESNGIRAIQSAKARSSTRGEVAGGDFDYPAHGWASNNGVKRTLAIECEPVMCGLIKPRKLENLRRLMITFLKLEEQHQHKNGGGWVANTANVEA